MQACNKLQHVYYERCIIKPHIQRMLFTTLCVNLNFEMNQSDYRLQTVNSLARYMYNQRSF